MVTQKVDGYGRDGMKNVFISSGPLRGCGGVPGAREAAARLRVAYLAGHVVAVDVGLLQEHVQAALVLRQRVAGDLVDEHLQACNAPQTLINMYSQLKNMYTF